jgi:hypothetical protein
MLSNTLTQAQRSYISWDSFKKDLESLGGIFLPVEWWLRARPKTPLPWTNLDMRDSIAEVIKIRQEARYY